MAKSVSNKKNFTFVGGLNTEAGPLTFPPNAWADGINVVPDVDGSVSKRTAINYEANYALSTIQNTATAEESGAFVCGEWNAAGGNGAYNFVVVQRADKLHFYVNNGDSISSREQVDVTVDLAAYKVAGNPNATGVAPCAFSNADGHLLVTSADTDPLLITYSVDTGAFTARALTLYIRDLVGVDDGLAVDEQPTTMTNEHRYNLFNQGWTDTQSNAYAATHSRYPSNAQVWTAGKNATDDFDPALLVKQDFGTSPAAKGRYVLPAFYRNRDSVSGIPGGMVETELYRPSTNAFYAGRAWYAGMKSSVMGTWVMFSQVATVYEKYGFCYQEADPTSEFISDLVATDGGVIPIQDAGNIISLRPAYNSMLVFADNGIWQIAGSLDDGFSATSYNVKKLTSIGCISAQSIVEADSVIFYWSNDGIWRISRTATGTLQVDSVTDNSVRTLYSGIPITGRVFSSGRFHTETKRIYWLYNDDEDQDGIGWRFKKSMMLVLDLRLPAFYQLSISALSNYTPYITDLVITKNRTSLTRDYDVADSDDNLVVDASGNQVVVTLTPGVLRNTDVRFMTMVPVGPVYPFFFVGYRYKLTFSAFDDVLTTAQSLKDWYNYDSTGTTYAAYLLTGYDLGNNQGGDKLLQGLYITCFFRRTEQGVDSSGNPINASGCVMQSRWDWTDNTVAGKWSAGEQVYRHVRPFFPSIPSATYTDGYPVVVTKSKVRGRGRTVQLLFTADLTKDMQLLGWAITYIGNANV